jgi:hypothetical protein
LEIELVSSTDQPADAEIVLDVELFPWGHKVVFEDLQTLDTPGVPDGAATDIWCWATPHSIDVYTMTQDQSDDAERLVRVRVLRGTGTQGLGDLVFDGNLELTTGILAVGSELGAPPPEDRQLSLGVGTVALKIFTAKAVQAAKAGTPDEYPLSGPTDVTVLLHPNT